MPNGNDPWGPELPRPPRGFWIMLAIAIGVVAAIILVTSR